MITDGLETDRLLFRSLTMKDKADLMNFYGDPEVTRYYYFEHDPETNCIKGIEKQLQRYKTYNSGLAVLILKSTNELVGMCGLLHQEVENEIALEVGYGLIRTYWGQGLASEAAQVCRDFAFTNNMSQKLISMIHPENINSQHVAERNGMKHTETIKFKGHDMFIYSIAKEEWLSIKLSENNSRQP